MCIINLVVKTTTFKTTRRTITIMENMKWYKQTLALILANEVNKRALRWEDIYQSMRKEIKFDNHYFDGLGIKKPVKQITKECIRQKVFKELQADRELCLKYGVPISINAVGVIITKDKDKIQAYLDGEKRRALSILKNSKAIKETYNFMLHGGGYDNENE